jgi:hypothetical protein
MVRLLAYRASAAALKRALSISDRLTPQGWKYLAITQAILAVFSFCVYSHIQEREVRPVEREVLQSIHFKSYPDGLTDLDLFVYDAATTRTRSIISEQLIRSTVSERAFSPNGKTVVTIDPAASWALLGLKLWTDDMTVSDIDFSTSRAQAGRIDVFNFYSHAYAHVGSDTALMALGHIHLRASAPASTAKPLLYQGGVSDWPRIPNLPRFEPDVLYSLSPPTNTSLLDSLQKLLLLIQGIVLTIGSVFASVFGYIGYHRGKIDLKLKQIQVRTAELELERLQREVERERREAERAGIVVVSG